MLKRLFAGICAAIVITTGFAMPAMAATGTDSPTDIVLAKINEYRQQNNVPVLPAQDPRLVAIAQQWAEELQSDPSQAMVHNPNLWAMIQPATSGGETVSEYYSEYQVATKWYQSGSHRPIITSAAWNAVGIGYVHDETTGLYWIVADFAYYPPAADTAVPAKADAPTITRDDLSATVNWSATTGQGHEVKLYNAAGDQVASSGLVRNPTNSYQFSNLNRGETYHATLSEYNANGMGDDSDPSATITIPALAPLEVTTAYALRQDFGTVFTYWWASKNANGAPVNTYTLNLYQDGDLYRTDTADASNGLSHNYVNLPDGHTYKVGVIANNTIGASPEVISAAGAYLPVIPTQQNNPSNPITNPISQANTPQPVITNPIVTNPVQTVTDPIKSVTSQLPSAVPSATPAPTSLTLEAGPTAAPVETVQAPVSPTSPAVTAPKPAVNQQAKPATPQVSVKVAAHRKLTVTWRKAGTNSGTSIAKYTVRIKQGAWVRTYTVSAATLSKTVTVPSAKTQAQVTVTAYNATKHATASAVKRSAVKR